MYSLAIVVFRNIAVLRFLSVCARLYRGPMWVNACAY